MAKANKHKYGHPNFLHLGEVLHNVQGGCLAAYDWLTGPAMSEKERDELARALLAYCERDTLALVSLHKALLALASSP